MDGLLNIKNLFLMITGTLFLYISKLYKTFYWECRVTKQDVDNLISQCRHHFKYQEDRIDSANPRTDAGLLIHRRFFCNYSTIQNNNNQGLSDFMMSMGILSAEYRVTSIRFFRKRLLLAMDIANREELFKKPKIYLVDTSSLMYVGDVEEEYDAIPDIILSKLNGGRNKRLNIFLHGTIGTGKTTLARAIAKSLNQSIYILAMSSWWGITDFVRALQRIPDNSVILFDDIDMILEQLFSVNNDKGNTTSVPSKFTTANILALLDGILMKDKKWVIILCTNKPDDVRKYLRLRAGRIQIDLGLSKTFDADYIHKEI